MIPQIKDLAKKKLFQRILFIVWFLALLGLAVFTFTYHNASPNYSLLDLLEPDHFEKNTFIFVGICSAFFVFLFLINFFRDKPLFKKLNDFLFSKKFFVLIIAFLTLFFSYVAIKKYVNFGDYTFDFGLQIQVIFNTSMGRLYQSSLEVSNFLGDHFAPMMILPAIIYRIFPGDITVLVTQVLFIAVGSIGIYLLTLKLTGKRYLASFLGVAFFIFPNLTGVMIWDFHEIAIAIPFLTFGLYFLHCEKKFKYAIICFVLAALCKEDVGLLIGGIGLYHFLINRDKKFLGLTIAGFAWTAIAYFVMIPAFRNGVAADSIVRYSEFGATGGEVAKNIVLHPLQVLSIMFESAKVQYLIKLLLPLGFLSFLAPLTLIMIIPALMVNLLSNSAVLYQGSAHYDVTIVIGLFYGFILTIVKLQKSNINIKPWIIGLVAISPAMILFSQSWQYYLMHNINYNDYLELQQIKKTIPQNAVLSVTNVTGAFFGDRQYLQLFDVDWDQYWDGKNIQPDYILVYKHVDYTDAVLASLKDSEANGYKIVLDDTSFTELRKD